MKLGTKRIENAVWETNGKTEGIFNKKRKKTWAKTIFITVIRNSLWAMYN